MCCSSGNKFRRRWSIAMTSLNHAYANSFLFYLRWLQRPHAVHPSISSVPDGLCWQDAASIWSPTSGLSVTDTRKPFWLPCPLIKRNERTQSNICFDPGQAQKATTNTAQCITMEDKISADQTLFGNLFLPFSPIESTDNNWFIIDLKTFTNSTDTEPRLSVFCFKTTKIKENTLL